MEIDFITAFGRLLRDGSLRDVYAASPQAAAGQIRLRRPDLALWLQLVPEDVEFQATVLLRKRLELVKYFVPETSRRAGERLSAAFRGYARTHWPPDGCDQFFDTYLFCQHLDQHLPGTVVRTEWNRLAFVASERRVAVHWVRLPVAPPGWRFGIQFFVRGPGRQRQEFLFYFRL